MGRRHPRHVIARRDQAKNFALPKRTLPDGADARVAGKAVIVNHDAATFTQGQPRLACQRILRADTRRKHHQPGFQALAVGEIQRQPGWRGANFAGGFTGMNADAQRRDFVTQPRCASRVQLHRHQVRREFHHMGVQPQLFQGVGGFKTQQTAADHHTALHGFRPFADGVQIVKRTIHKAARELMTRNGRHKRPGAGRQHQSVPAGFPAFDIAYYLAIAVDIHNAATGAQFYAVCGEEIGLRQGKRVGAAPGKIF